MTKWLLLAGSILSEVTGSLSLKGALDRPGLYVLVAAGYIASFILLALVLRQGMALLAVVEAGMASPPQIGIFEPVQHEQRPLDLADFL